MTTIAPPPQPSQPSQPSQPTQSSPPTGRDTRIDNLGSWALNLAATIAIAVAAWQFNALTNEVKGVRSDLGSITTRVAIIESERLRERQDKLEERLRVVEGKVK